MIVVKRADTFEKFADRVNFQITGHDIDNVVGGFDLLRQFGRGNRHGNTYRNRISGHYPNGAATILTKEFLRGSANGRISSANDLGGGRDPIPRDAIRSGGRGRSEDGLCVRCRD